jgi:hypothetical protein
MVANVTSKKFDNEFVKGRLEPEFDEYEHYYLLCRDPAKNTSQAQAGLKSARKTVDKSATIAVNMIKSNVSVTNAEKDTLRIAFGTGGSGKPASAPATSPEFFIKKQKEIIQGHLAIGYKDFGQKLEGRPPHVGHMRYVYLVSDVIFFDRKLLTEQGIDTASPIVKDFPYALHGKSFGISGCWVSNAGEEGPWSEVVWFTIP